MATKKAEAKKKYQQLRAKDDQKQRNKMLYQNKEWYTIRALLGHHNVN